MSYGQDGLDRPHGTEGQTDGMDRWDGQFVHDSDCEKKIHELRGGISVCDDLIKENQESTES